MDIHPVVFIYRNKPKAEGKKMIAVQNLEAGMNVILEGRKQAVEVLTIDNFGNAGLYKIGHYGKGFNVTALPAGTMVRLAA